jgi:hypothetical protein
MDKQLQWYLNTVTGEPELGMMSSSTQRMGPYASREDALKAWKIAKQRNDDWEAANDEWNQWYDDDEKGNKDTSADGSV